MRGYAVDKQTINLIETYFYTNGFMLWYLSKQTFCKGLARNLHLHWRTVEKYINEIIK